MNGFIKTLFLGIMALALASASPNREARGIFDLPSKLVGGAIGVMGTAFHSPEESRYKCVHIMGYGYSGPDSVYPERYDKIKPESESNSILDSMNRGLGFMYGNTFNTFLPDSANQEICRQVGMGYHDPQPGYPQTPGGGGPISSQNEPSPTGNQYYQPGTVGSINYQPGTPGSTYYQPGTPGSVNYQPGTPGSVSYQPGTTQTVNYQPGTPGSVNYQPGTPGSVSYQPGTTQTVSYQPGTTQTVSYLPGTTQTVSYQPGTPGMCPCKCPA